MENKLIIFLSINKRVKNINLDDIKKSNSKTIERKQSKPDDLIEIEVINTDPSIKHIKSTLKQSQSIKNNLKLNISKKDIYDRRSNTGQNFQTNLSKDKNRKVVNSLSSSKLKVNTEDLFKNIASMISARSTKSNSTNIVSKDRTLATSTSKEKILKTTLTNSFKVTNNLTTQKSSIIKSNFKIVKVTSNLKTKIEKHISKPK